MLQNQPETIDARAPEWLHPVIHRLRRLGAASASELAFAAGAVRTRSRHAIGEELLAARGHDTPLFVVKGWAASQHFLADGRRQIFRLFIPGDLIGPPAGAGARGVQIVALSPLETAAASSLVGPGLQASPGLRRALVRAAALDDQLLLDHVVRLGQLRGPERLAHLLLELRDRLAAVGLGDRSRFPLPLRQDLLADLLGLSLVHTSRVKTELCAAGLIEMRAGQVIILQPEKLAAFAGRTHAA